LIFRRSYMYRLKGERLFIYHNNLSQIAKWSDSYWIDWGRKIRFSEEQPKNAKASIRVSFDFDSSSNVESSVHLLKQRWSRTPDEEWIQIDLNLSHFQPRVWNTKWYQWWTTGKGFPPNFTQPRSRLEQQRRDRFALTDRVRRKRKVNYFPTIFLTEEGIQIDRKDEKKESSCFQFERASSRIQTQGRKDLSMKQPRQVTTTELVDWTWNNNDLVDGTMKLWEWHWWSMKANTSWSREKDARK
jgi:hypothetical protein